MIDNIVINIRWRSTSFRNPDGLLPWSTQPRRKLTSSPVQQPYLAINLE